MTNRVRWTRSAWLLGALWSVLLGGCSKELLAGGQREGEVSAVATDGAGGAASRSPEAGPLRTRRGAAAPGGELELTASVSLVDEEGDEVPVTPGPSTVRVRIAAADSALLGRGEVGEGRYTRARVRFSGVRATLTEGLVVGGVPLTGQVTVAIGAQPLVVEAPIVLEVREGSRGTVVVEMNAAVWLAAANPVTRRVPEAAFRGAVRVRAR